MPDETKLRAYMQRAEAELRENILPFWINHTVDKANGGFYGQISNSLVIDEQAPRGALLSARILWTFAAAYRRYQNITYLNMADWAYQDLLTRFWDAEYGGFYWQVAVDGTPLRDRKQIYGQAFGIYALAEYFAATGESEALEKAKAIFQAMETHSHDPEHQGYFEAFSREWGPVEDIRLSRADINEMKSMNTHLHIMEAFTNLYRVWPDPALRTRLAELLDVMMHHIISDETYHQILFFDEAWASRSRNVSYGHDIEASWLLVESVEVLGDAGREARAKELAPKMAQAVYAKGLDPDGALVYEEGPEGLEDSTKQWWPQAEAAVGFLNAYQLTGEEHFLEAAYRSWDFVDAYLIDREHGEWIRYVTRDHDRPGEDGEGTAKVSFWKCPYHNGRACMELAERFYKLLTA
ncbi:MAG: AGE family epimerase/isomerase [Anaerolineae bacterium]|nr:AGE family epimerase/isomerase [Anaerolineae bacterium]